MVPCCAETAVVVMGFQDGEASSRQCLIAVLDFAEFSTVSPS